jgi:DNA-directed RNA polymerase specialized sigma24 family protein
MKEFKVIYKKYYGKVKGVFMRYFNEEISEKMTEKFFLKIFKNSSDFKSLEKYYKKIIEKILIDELVKSRNEFMVYDLNLTNFNQKIFEINFKDKKIDSFHLVNCMNKLNNVERWIYNLFLVENVSFKEISKTFEIEEEKCEKIFKIAKFNFEKTVFNAN